VAFRFCVVPVVTVVQAAPLVVLIMVPESPTEYPVLAEGKCTPRRFRTVPLVSADQAAPLLVVLMMFPVSPTAYPVVELPKETWRKAGPTRMESRAVPSTRMRTHLTLLVMEAGAFETNRARRMEKIGLAILLTKAVSPGLTEKVTESRCTVSLRVGFKVVSMLTITAFQVRRAARAYILGETDMLPESERPLTAYR
jgi:hypothetical protein